MQWLHRLHGTVLSCYANFPAKAATVPFCKTTVKQLGQTLFYCCICICICIFFSVSSFFLSAVFWVFQSIFFLYFTCHTVVISICLGFDGWDPNAAGWDWWATDVFLWGTGRQRWWWWGWWPTGSAVYPHCTGRENGHYTNEGFRETAAAGSGCSKTIFKGLLSYLHWVLIYY